MRNFEREIIDELLETSELKDVVLSWATENEVVEFSGAGYFLTIIDSVLPQHRIVLDTLEIRGKLCGIDVGYLAFVENSELMLECYSYGQKFYPSIEKKSLCEMPHNKQKQHRPTGWTRFTRRCFGR